MRGDSLRKVAVLFAQARCQQKAALWHVQAPATQATRAAPAANAISRTHHLARLQCWCTPVSRHREEVETATITTGQDPMRASAALRFAPPRRDVPY